MENNEISMFVDVKLTIHDKRPDYMRFKNWTRSLVKIEAVKCFPCFLRITIVPESEEANDEDEQRSLNVPIIVPGVTVSLASSRTKQHSYGLFWKQNRRDCFIYFAVDTDANCRRHMKWVKRSIRNLELYRQLLLEQRRSSRGPVRLGQLTVPGVVNAEASGTKEDKDTDAELFPNSNEENNCNNSSWSRRVSHVSNIYEEICEGNETPPRLSRRLSRASIASGIYEEMKCTNNSFNAIDEEAPEPPPLPPLPAQRKRFNTLEIDNFAGLIGDIPRSNTNPECEMAKKKKYKKVLENIFGSGRSKRTKSVSESQACSAEDVINCITPKHNSMEENADTPLYSNDTATIVSRKRHRQQLMPKSVAVSIADSKRNSFSSPDLSKINFLDTFDEQKYNHAMQNDSLTTSDELNLSSHSLDESAILAGKSAASVNVSVADLIAQIRANQSKSGSLESLNISQQIPHNFNFSACNTSTINLMGAHVANNSLLAKLQKPELRMDDLSGYCFMAPIKATNSPLATAEHESEANVQKSAVPQNEFADYCFMAPIKKKIPSNNVANSQPETSSSGYSTGSYCSSTSSCTNSTEDHLSQQRPHAVPQTTPPSTLNEESVIYESMHMPPTNESTGEVAVETPPTMTDFTGNLYENLLTVKAAQELEQVPTTLTTSTPTDSPHTEVQIDGGAQSANGSNNVQGNDLGGDDGEESYYQTPRKSIISVDDKIPSYYPNSCDTVKMRRSSQGQSPSITSSTVVVTPNIDRSTLSSNSMGLRHLVGIKKHRERKESHYISSPQNIIEQRHNSITSICSTVSIMESNNKSSSKTNHKNCKKTGTTTASAVAAAAAHKISEHVYTVVHPNSIETTGKRKSLQKSGKKDPPQTEDAFNEELKEKLQRELLTMAMLQNIDFKFDDTKALMSAESTNHEVSKPSTPSSLRTEGEEENYYKTITNGTRSVNHLAEKYINMSPRHIISPPRAPAQHHLKLNQQANQQTPISSTMTDDSSPCTVMTQSKLEVPVSVGSDWSSGVKKFASLPRFKKIDFSPLKLKINNVLQRNHHHHTPQQQQQQF